MNEPLLIVDTTDPTPPYEQLRRQLADLIGAGVLQPGARLPPLRQLAADLGLAVGTVGRAYAELEGAGLLTSRRGAGTRVSVTARRPAPDLRSALDAHAEAYVRAARVLAAEDEDVRAALERALVSSRRPAAR